MIKDIKVFVEVIKAGSFTAAAERLDISKSVVSKQVTRLERELGVQLLNRTTRHLGLTEAGETLYQRAKQSLSELEEALFEARKATKEPKGLLKLNVPMSFGISHLGPALAKFAAQYPEIRLDINLDDRKIEMIEPGFDLSIRIGKLADSSLIAKRLTSCHQVIVASPEYIKCNGPIDQPEQLADHSVVTFRYQESAMEWSFRSDRQKASPTLEQSVLAKSQNNGNEHRVRVSGSITANNSLLLKEVVKAGHGIARIPSFLVESDIRDGLLLQVLSDYHCPSFNVYAIYPKRDYLPRKVNVFIDFLSNYWGDSI